MNGFQLVLILTTNVIAVLGFVKVMKWAYSPNTSTSVKPKISKTDLTSLNQEDVSYLVSFLPRKMAKMFIEETKIDPRNLSHYKYMYTFCLLTTRKLCIFCPDIILSHVIESAPLLNSTIDANLIVAQIQNSTQELNAVSQAICEELEQQPGMYTVNNFVEYLEKIHVVFLDDCNNIIEDSGPNGQYGDNWVSEIGFDMTEELKNELVITLKLLYFRITLSLQESRKKNN